MLFFSGNMTKKNHNQKLKNYYERLEYQLKSYTVKIRIIKSETHVCNKQQVIDNFTQSILPGVMMSRI